jgi:DNA-directed RNA polymerase delta subunit
MEAEEEIAKRNIFRNKIRENLKFHNIVNDVSKLYKKTVFTLNTDSGLDSSLIELGEYKWYATFLIFYYIYILKSE